MATHEAREATYQVTTGRAMTHSEATLREAVNAGLLTLENGEYSPTPRGLRVSNEVAMGKADLEFARRRNARIIAAARLAERTDPDAMMFFESMAQSSQYSK